MIWVKMYPGRQSEWCWRCPQCRVNKVQERSGSIFANSTLPLEKIVALLHFWAHGLPVKTTSELLSLQQNTVTNWFKVKLTSLPWAIALSSFGSFQQNLRTICQNWLDDNPIQIGGMVGQRRLRVEIDESLVARRKYNR